MRHVLSRHYPRWRWPVSLHERLRWRRVAPESVWPNGVVQQIRLVGEIFANALSRAQAYELFQAATSQLSLLQASLHRNEPTPLDAVSEAACLPGMIGQSAVLRAVRFRRTSGSPSIQPCCCSEKPAWARS